MSRLHGFSPEKPNAMAFYHPHPNPLPVGEGADRRPIAPPAAVRRSNL